MLPNPNSTSNIISDSVHCDPLTQVTVSYGSRCHTDDTLKERKDTVAREPCSLPFSFSSPPPPWVYTFSKSRANSSLRTQCAAVCSDVTSPTVFHRRLRRARKKCRKIDKPLREIVVPLTQVKLYINEIDSEIIVFDGGNESTPPIRPPDDIRWRSIPIRHLHIEDELRGNIGLSFQKIEGVSPFIRLP